MPAKATKKIAASKSQAAKKKNGKAAKAMASKKVTGKRNAPKTNGTVRDLHAVSPKARSVTQYEHKKTKRLNNPPVGLVTPDTDPDLPPRTYAFDPHLDPQLTWSGKEEKSALTLDTVSLHVHERIDSYSIISSVRRKNGAVEQPSLFARPEENPPFHEALDFYKHQHDWSNRLIAGDSALVMNSLLEREGMAGKVQMIYIDPPYGIRYGSNFQPFVNRRDVKEGDEDLTREPEMVRAFRDTWELGIHSYLTYLRDRLVLARELLTDSGSCFVQISNENVHLVRNLCDEIFGSSNFISQISFNKSSGLGGNYIPTVNDYIIWYAKNKEVVKFRPLFRTKQIGEGIGERYSSVMLADGSSRPMTSQERTGDQPLPRGAKAFTLSDPTAQGYRPNTTVPFTFQGKVYHPGDNRCWRTTTEGLERLVSAKRLVVSGSKLRYVRYMDDFPAFPFNNVWTDIGGIASRVDGKIYVVQTSTSAISRCLLMTTDPGDLVFDPTCGSGTTAVVAERWGRRWITCDTSRVAIVLAKQRLMTSTYEFFQLRDEDAGIDGGLVYHTIPHVTMKSIATNEPPEQEQLYDDPFEIPDKVRVTGPFTVEAVPAPLIASMAEELPPGEPDMTLGRSGPTLRQSEWRTELLKTGVRTLNGKTIRFSRVEPVPATKFIHAEAETIEEKPQRVAISFGPDYAPLEQRQVQAAWKEAQMLNPAPTMLLFAAFQFDPEAAKDIDEMNPALTKMTFLKVQMNTDLLTSDLKKKRAANESFWLIGRPDVECEKVGDRYVVRVHGFDYYNIKTGDIESGNANRIAMWMLDPDYDERSLFPKQVFFPMSGETDGWAKLARSLRGEIDEDLIESYRGTASLPFTGGENQKVAVKIIDDRGVESMRVITLQ